MRNPRPRRKNAQNHTSAATSSRRQNQVPPPANPSDSIPDLREFTESLFRHVGATVAPVDKRRKHGPLRVLLPAHLVDHFGGDTLTLAFQSVEEGSGQQLVAHGSRTFDRMLALLKRESALTVRRLPAHHMGSEALLRAVRPRNAGIANLRLQEQQEPLCAFTWRLTYRADDKREELYTVLLDGSGARLALGEGAGSSARAGLPDLETLLAESTAQPLQEVDDRATDEAQAQVAQSGDEVAGEREAAGIQTQTPSAGSSSAGSAVTTSPEGALRLPAMAHLVRLAERARKFAIYHADARCVAHEAEILPRLYKVLDRLTNYYAQQVEEVSGATDPLGERRAALEADLERKIAEEIENHRLRVQVDLCAYAILYLPVASAEMLLRDGQREARLGVRLDRYTGTLIRPTCFACGQEMDAVVLDRNGHVHCEACLRQCENCLEIVCASCGVEACPACGKENCENCGRACWACGRRACADHISRCPVCGDDACHACQECCAECGVLQCRSHLRADAVREPDGSSRRVCAACAIRCPGCKQYSARLGVCHLSGQRFCTNCLVTCSQCGRSAGPGYYARLPDTGAPVCSSCVAICPSCGAVARDSTLCDLCEAECCASCRGVCCMCGREACSEHWSKADGCGHILCSEHAGICAIGGETVCPKCSTPCAICERVVCTHHQRTCAWCGRIYCSDCVGADHSLCTTCQSAIHAPNPIDMALEPVANQADVRVLAPRYQWRKASNHAVTVYLGRSPRGAVLVVVRSTRDGRTFVLTRHVSIDGA